MDWKEFEKYIKSIGFKKKLWYYEYKEYKIDLWNEYYDFSGKYDIPFTDLTPLEKVFKKELRSIKVKELLR